MLVHTLFDLAAWLCALLAGLYVAKRHLAASSMVDTRRIGPIYVITAAVGTLLGTFGLGTLNLSLAGQSDIGRSILGGTIGGIVAVESYKLVRGIRGSTGIIFVIPLTLGIAIGRVGCFLAGLDDFTYGTPTALPWGVDLGDGVARHPVQLYESLSMVAFLVPFLWLLRKHSAVLTRGGFYLFALAYGIQRFLWEFLKPYPVIIGPFNVFHLACLFLILYALTMLLLAEPAHARA